MVLSRMFYSTSPHFVCVYTDTPFSSPFLCLQTFLALLINYSALSLTLSTPPPPILYLISLPGSCRLRRVMSEMQLDKGDSADPNLYRSSARLGCALLLNVYNAFTIH